MTSPFELQASQTGGQVLQKAKPFLRWAGGKRAVAQRIAAHFPSHFEYYYEPFIGAGSLMFEVQSNVNITISDFNEELMVTYNALQNNLEGVLSALSNHDVSKQHYLEVRDWDRDPRFKIRRTESDRAARFIFLNKCGFNGLYRVNSKGHYNIPYGNPKKNLDLMSENNLRSVSNFLNGEGSTEKRPVKMLQGEFEKFFSECFHKSGEIIAKPTSHFVYLDPPYDIEPESLIPGFVSYNENGFGESHQISLAKEVHALTDMGIPVLMSNTNTSRINNLYPKSIFGYEFLEVRRSISAKSSSRGVINEVLINNYAQVGVSKN